MFSKLFDSILGRKPEPQKPKVSITSVNLKFMGNLHSLNGINVPSRAFEYRIPFQNKMGSDLLPDNVKGPKVTISTITVSEPFKLLDVSPKLPVSIEYQSKESFTLRIEAPDLAYDGPISINFGNESSDNIALSISKVVLSRNGRTVDLENSELTATMQKNQVFKKEIQLYKILSFNETLSRIEVSKPFELVSVQPQLPILADKKDSYIINLYLKAPKSSYAGSIEIKMS